MEIYESDIDIPRSNKMWQELINLKDKWIGGKLIDYGDPIDKALMGDKYKPMETEIVDLKLTDETIEFIGKDFPVIYNRKYIGLVAIHVENGLAFSGYGGHRIDIVKPNGGDNGDL